MFSKILSCRTYTKLIKKKKEETKKAQPKRSPNSPYNLPFLWIS